MPEWNSSYRTLFFDPVPLPLNTPLQILTGNSLRMSIIFSCGPAGSLSLGTTNQLIGQNGPAVLVFSGAQVVELKRDVNRALICEPWYIVQCAGTVVLCVTEEFWLPPS